MMEGPSNHFKDAFSGVFILHCVSKGAFPTSHFLPAALKFAGLRTVCFLKGGLFVAIFILLLLMRVLTFTRLASAFLFLLSLCPANSQVVATRVSLGLCGSPELQPCNTVTLFSEILPVILGGGEREGRGRRRLEVLGGREKRERDREVGSRQTHNKAEISQKLIHFSQFTVVRAHKVEGPLQTRFHARLFCFLVDCFLGGRQQILEKEGEGRKDASDRESARFLPNFCSSFLQTTSLQALVQCT